MIGLKIAAPDKVNINEFQKAAEAVASGSVVQIIKDGESVLVQIEAPDDADLDAIKQAVLFAPVDKTDAELIIERAQKEQSEKSFDFVSWRSEVERRLDALEGKR